MAIREGRWDCPSCGSTAIYGRHVDCPGCGKPRPAGVRFYLASGEPVVTDPERLREAHAGADWVCEHCVASNRALLDQCGGCGAARGSSPTQPVKRYDDGEVPRTGGPSPAPLAAAGFGAPDTRRKRRAPGWIAGGLVVAVVGGGILQECEMPERTLPPVAAVVEDVQWEHQVQVLTRTMVAGEGWELPDSATDVQQSTRVREHRKEVAGHHTTVRVQPRRVQQRVGERKRWVGGGSSTSCETVDMGNGYFSEECEESGGGEGSWVMEPVYRTVTVHDTIVEQAPFYRSVPVHATYYTYRVPEMVQTDVRRTAGGAATPPFWPDTTDAPGRRTFEQGRYRVILRDAGGNRHEVWLSEEEWRRYRPGQRVAYAPAGGDRYQAHLFPRDSLRECRRWHRGRGKPPADSLGCSPRR